MESLLASETMAKMSSLVSELCFTDDEVITATCISIIFYILGLRGC